MTGPTREELNSVDLAAQNPGYDPVSRQKDPQMNILKKIVKETVLIPYRVFEGVVAAYDEVLTPKKGEEQPPR